MKGFIILKKLITRIFNNINIKEKIAKQKINQVYESSEDEIIYSNKEIEKEIREKKDNSLLLVDYNIGIVKNYGEEDSITGKKRNYGFINTLTSKDLYLHKNDLDDKSTKKNDIVIFKYGKNEKGEVAKNIITLKINSISLERLIYFIDIYYETNSIFFKSSQISKLIKTFLSDKYSDNIAEYNYIKLLNIYNKEDKLELIDNYITLKGKVTNELLTIVEDNLNHTNIEQFLNLENKNLLLKNKRIEDKLKLFPKFTKSKFKDFLDDIKVCVNYKHIPVSYESNDIYNLLEDVDYKLAKQWIQRISNLEFEYSRMISARGAEIASKKFYESLNYNVTDTAISQLDYKDDSWKFYDLSVGNKYVDVKNSRGVLNEKLSYSEHCIPKFKETRNGNNIYILGVISPYFKLDKGEEKLIHNAFRSTSNIEDMVTILGETSFESINKYSKRFSNENLQIDLSKINFIPDWILEYPEEFYKSRNILKNEFIKKYIELPSAIEYMQINQNIIPFFLSCGLDLPDDYIEGNAFETILNNAQINFYNRLKIQARKTVTKPFLYLAILKHFTEKLKDFDINYTPQDYIKILYYEENYKYPLGIYDPTLIIKKFIDTLERLWKQKDGKIFQKYITFKYNQKGVLLGKTSMSSSWDTLLAYCGGFIEGKGSCGFKPLNRNIHDICSCNKIICPECGFCKDNCTLCLPRKKKYLVHNSSNRIKLIISG